MRWILLISIMYANLTHLQAKTPTKDWISFGVVRGNFLWYRGVGGLSKPDSPHVNFLPQGSDVHWQVQDIRPESAKFLNGYWREDKKVSSILRNSELFTYLTYCFAGKSEVYED